MIYFFIFIAAAANEAILATWTQAVSERRKVKALASTIVLEFARIPTLLLVTSQPFGSREQVIRAAVATIGYAFGVFLLLTLEKKR